MFHIFTHITNLKWTKPDPIDDSIFVLALLLRIDQYGKATNGQNSDPLSMINALMKSVAFWALRFCRKKIKCAFIANGCLHMRAATISSSIPC